MREKRLKEIGLRIKNLRGKENQIDFSLRINSDQKALSRYENGKSMPPLTLLLKIMEVSNVSLDWLLAGVEESVDYGFAYEQALKIPEVQMLVSEIGCLPKEKQGDIARHLLDTIQLLTIEKK